MSKEYELHDLAMLKLQQSNISGLSSEKLYYKYREEHPGFDPGGNYLKPRF